MRTAAGACARGDEARHDPVVLEADAHLVEDPEARLVDPLDVLDPHRGPPSGRPSHARPQAASTRSMFSFAAGLTTRRDGVRVEPGDRAGDALGEAHLRLELRHETPHLRVVEEGALGLVAEEAPPLSGTSAAMRALGTWTSRASAPAARAIVS